MGGSPEPAGFLRSMGVDVEMASSKAAGGALRIEVQVSPVEQLVSLGMKIQVQSLGNSVASP